jgi:hypothetical protein
MNNKWIARTLRAAMVSATITAGLAFHAGAKEKAMSTLNFMGKTYQLASHNEKNNRPMWEFTTGGEPIDQWTTLFTLIDRPEAQSKVQLDQLSEGVMQFYKTHGGQVLAAKTMKGASGEPFNYLVAAFEQPQTHTFELNFVKLAMGPKNAYTAIYGVRISDPKDYLAKTKKFISEHSSEIGLALGEAKLPVLSSLPRRQF